MNSSFSSYHPHPGAIYPIIQIVQCKTASAAPQQQRRPLPSFLSLSFFYGLIPGPGRMETGKKLFYLHLK